MESNQTATSELPINSAFIFSDKKGKYKPGREKRQRKFISSLCFIKPFLEPDETIQIITRGCRSMSFMEQFFMGMAIYAIKRAYFVFTNKRVLIVLTNHNYKYQRALAQMRYEHIKKMRMRGNSLLVIYGNNKKERYYYVQRKEHAKIKELISNINFQPKETISGGKIFLCPRCTKKLQPEIYTCQNCLLEFKNKSDGLRMAILFPGGGYFYTRHFFLGLGDALTEIFLICMVCIIAVALSKGQKELLYGFIFFSMILFLEKLTSILHSNKFIEEYIPVEKELEVHACV